MKHKIVAPFLFLAVLMTNTFDIMLVTGIGNITYFVLYGLSALMCLFWIVFLVEDYSSITFDNLVREYIDKEYVKGRTPANIMSASKWNTNWYVAILLALVFFGDWLLAFLFIATVCFMVTFSNSLEEIINKRGVKTDEEAV